MVNRIDVEKTSNRNPDNYCSYCGVFNGFIHSQQCSHFHGEDVIPLTNDRVRASLDKLYEDSKPPLHIVTTIPPEVEQYVPEIGRFVEAMVYKLGVHSKKGKWENLEMPRAVDLLKGEVKELEEAIGRGNMVEQLLEAADVANYALIISAKAMEK